MLSLEILFFGFPFLFFLFAEVTSEEKIMLQSLHILVEAFGSLFDIVKAVIDVFCKNGISDKGIYRSFSIFYIFTECLQVFTNCDKFIAYCIKIIAGGIDVIESLLKLGLKIFVGKEKSRCSFSLACRRNDGFCSTAQVFYIFRALAYFQDG